MVRCNDEYAPIPETDGVIPGDSYEFAYAYESIHCGKCKELIKNDRYLFHERYGTDDNIPLLEGLCYKCVTKSQVLVAYKDFADYMREDRLDSLSFPYDIVEFVAKVINRV